MERETTIKEKANQVRTNKLVERENCILGMLRWESHQEHHPRH